MLTKSKAWISDGKTKDAIKIIRVGLEAARPENFLGKFIKSNKILVRSKSISFLRQDRVFLIAVGKAAAPMTKFVCRNLRVAGGIAVVPRSYKIDRLGNKIKVIYASHPIPDASSVNAASSVVGFLQSMRKNDFVVFLVSGGASSLLALPQGLSLNQKQQATNALLKSGASIEEINAVRKHLSQIKGGQILTHLKCPAVSYVMSDVVGDDLSTIASGLTYCDKTTFSDCLRIIAKYRLESSFPAAAIRRIEDGATGLIPETPKRPKIPNVIVATNKRCLAAMTLEARLLGYSTNTLYPTSGQVDTTAKKILASFSSKKKSCLVFGGETTVHVKGSGKGGRNQELVLRVATKIKNNTVIASVGTDGVDGNTKYAGAIFSHASTKVANMYLKNNNSNSFFKKYGGLVMTGPTNTNLMDIGLILTE